MTASLLEFGWIDVERFGRQAADDASLIVQHSGDLRLMRPALPFIEADVRAGRLGGERFALLFDRVQLDLGRLQRYGTQLGRTEAGEWVLMPCQDFEAVDARRAEVGLPALASYLEHFRESPHDPPIRRLEEAL